MALRRLFHAIVSRWTRHFQIRLSNHQSLLKLTQRNYHAVTTFLLKGTSQRNDATLLWEALDASCLLHPLLNSKCFRISSSIVVEKTFPGLWYGFGPEVNTWEPSGYILFNAISAFSPAAIKNFETLTTLKH